MTNISSKHYDEIFGDMENELEKLAKRTFVSENSYEQYLAGMSCEEIKQHNPSSVRVPGEARTIYNRIKRQKCSQKNAAVEFAIQYITKVADELDKNGFIEVANILDESLQKFAALHDCEDCEQ